MLKNKMNVQTILNRILQDYDLVLSSDCINTLVEKCEIKEFSKNEMLLQLGDHNDFVYFIISGCVRSYFLSCDGKDMTRYIVRAGELCAEEVLLGKTESNYNIEALEDGCMMLISGCFIKEIIFHNPQAKKIYIEGLEKALLYKMKREHSFMILDAHERYLEFKEEYGGLENIISQKHLASYLGITPETLCRIKKDLSTN